MVPWHKQTIESVLINLHTNVNGISNAEAELRLNRYGQNRLEEKRRKSPLIMLFQQFTETMVVILIVAAIVSFLLARTTEGVAILAIVLLFGFLGFIQEYRAERAMAALIRMVVPMVRVRRNGKTRGIPAKDLVPGDVVEFEAGNIIPADLRVIESYNLKIQEAALTGESEPVEKISEVIDSEDIPLGDRKNLAFLGTTVMYGRGAGVVYGTGMQTELGKIASLISQIEQKKTPLQGKLDKLGKILALVGVGAAIVIFIIGVVMGETVTDMFLTAVSLAVAVVPEGLPAVVTITLALGGQRMLKRNALIRKLPAVETLGSVTVICSDKTGTLTENKMKVTIIDVADQMIEIEAAPKIEKPWSRILDLSLAVSVLCNDAKEELSSGKLIGDPTELALLLAAAERNIFKENLVESLPRIDEVPFDSSRKRMSTVHAVNGAIPDYLDIIKGVSFIICTKGAVESILSISDYVWVKGVQKPLDKAWKGRILHSNQNLAQNGLRVLGVAIKYCESFNPSETVECGLTFIALIAMIDPPRLEVKEAIENCNNAGIKTIMITGDHPSTAAAIGKQLNFFHPSSLTVTGDQLQKIDENELIHIAGNASVYARVSPEDKLKIIEALQKRGEVVAMTGDGVNDSPALKKADIGVAMGITGTDVAKESSDMVLLDDNFATIVAAVEEGRVIFDNLRRFIKFSLAGNLGKVFVMMVAPVFGMVIALQPLQLLWLNLLTDGLLGLGLGTEPAEKDVMKRPPRKPEKGALDKKDYHQMMLVGIIIAVVSLGLALYYYKPGEPGDLTWQSMIFATIGFSQIFQALALRSSAHSPIAVKTNVLFAVMLVLTIFFHLAVIYLPFMEVFFNLVALPLVDLGVSIAAGSIVFFAVLYVRYSINAKEMS